MVALNYNNKLYILNYDDHYSIFKNHVLLKEFRVGRVFDCYPKIKHVYRVVYL